MFQKLRVWCRLKNRQWELGHIQSTSGEKASVLLSDKNVSSYLLVILLIQASYIKSDQVVVRINSVL